MANNGKNGPIVKTRGLAVYYEKHRGMVDVDLSVEKGGVFGFLGPNGAGKTSSRPVLLEVSVVVFVLALIGFQLRNVTVGAWPWQGATAPRRQKG